MHHTTICFALHHFSIMLFQYAPMTYYMASRRIAHRAQVSVSLSVCHIQ